MSSKFSQMFLKFNDAATPKFWGYSKRLFLNKKVSWFSKKSWDYLLGFYRRVLQKFFIADPFSAKNHQQMDLKPKKFCSPGYNLLFDIIATLSNAYFVSIAEFVDACDIHDWVPFFNHLFLQVSSLLLVRSALNLYTHQFTVDFVIIL